MIHHKAIQYVQCNNIIDALQISLAISDQNLLDLRGTHLYPAQEVTIRVIALNETKSHNKKLHFI